MARIKAAAVRDAALRRAEIAKRKSNPIAPAGEPAADGDKAGKPKRKRRRSKLKWLRKVRKEQGVASCKPAIPGAALERLVREAAPGFNFGKKAISALRVASNQYMVEVMQRSNTLCIHSGRQEIALKDMKQAVADMNREDTRVANHTSGRF